MARGLCKMDTEAYLMKRDFTSIADIRDTFNYLSVLDGIVISDDISNCLATFGFFYLGYQRIQCAGASCSTVIKLPLAQLDVNRMNKILHRHSQKSPNCIFFKMFKNQEAPQQYTDAGLLFGTPQSKLIARNSNNENNNNTQNLDIARMRLNNHKPPGSRSSQLDPLSARQPHLDNRQLDLQSTTSSKSSELSDTDIYSAMKPSVIYKDENSMEALLQTSATTGTQVAPTAECGVVVKQAEPPEEIISDMELDVESTGSSEESLESMDDVDLYGDEATVRDEEIRKWQELKLCKICRHHDANVVFVPCGHMCSCNSCLNAPDTVNVVTSWCKNCFKCGIHIEKLVKVSRA